jgi:hypothetical protein
VAVVFFVAVLGLALLLVAVTKGSFHRLGQLQFRHLWVLLVALIVQLVLEFVDFPKDRMEDVGVATLLASYVMIFVFCWLNRKVKGLPLITVGIMLNVLVISLNLGMPTKKDVRTVNGREVRVPIEQTVKHRPEDEDTLLPFLGDVITLPGLPNQQFSIGDIVIGLGIVDLCFEASRVPRRRGRPVSEPSAVRQSR